MIFAYEGFKQLLDKKFHVGQELYNSLIKNVVSTPHRYTGIFRLSDVKTKMIQNITQSQEIKFGDFMEELTTIYIDLMGYTNLCKDVFDKDGTPYNIDQIFQLDDCIYIIEQKMRDDHDSTKKRGQWNNFVSKVQLIKKSYPNMKVNASMWFVDDSMKKNNCFYQKLFNEFSEENVQVNLCYGKDLFIKVFNRLDVWEEITQHLWRNKVENKNKGIKIPDFDGDIIFNALKSLPNNLIKRLLSNDDVYVQLREELFPTGENIKRLLKYAQENGMINSKSNKGIN